MSAEESSDFNTLLEIMTRLRSSRGCPWDREQTHQSLKSFLIEEAYETIDAIDREDHEHLKEELGDLLLQIVFHAQIASENGQFDIGQVIDGITEKLKRRHPHIFGQLKVSSSQEVNEHWERIKQDEKEESERLEDIPASLPALLYALKIQAKAGLTGFDWPKIESIMLKLEEETVEFQKACREGVGVEEELGDLLFTVVNIARRLKLDPEEALRQTIKKFKARFEHMEKAAGQDLSGMSLEDQDVLWEEAKRSLTKKKNKIKASDDLPTRTKRPSS